MVTKSNTQAKRDERARKRAAGLRPKDIWLHVKADLQKIKDLVKSENAKHMTKAEIEAFCNAKTDKAKLIRECKK